MVACKNCKWYHEANHRFEGFDNWHTDCEHPSCFDKSYSPIEGTYYDIRKRFKRIVGKGKSWEREEWPEVDIWTKNENGDCPDFEAKPPIQSKKRWFR